MNKAFIHSRKAYNFRRRHLDFFQKIGFESSCILSAKQKICMKCQIPFSGKIRKLSSACRLLNLFKEWNRLNYSQSQ